jgi:hypothetical protein
MAERRSGRFLDIGGEDDGKKTVQRVLKDEARERMRHSYAQSKNNESVFRVVPGLHRVIPLVEHLDERTNKADEQSNRQDYSRRPRSHGRKYTPANSERTEIPRSKTIQHFSCRGYVTLPSSFHFELQFGPVNPLLRQFLV